MSRLFFYIILTGENGEESTFCVCNAWEAYFHCTYQLDTATLFQADGTKPAFGTALDLAKHVLHGFRNLSGADRAYERKRIDGSRKDFLDESAKKFGAGTMPKLLTIKKNAQSYGEEVDIDHFYPLSDQKLIELARKESLDEFAAYLANPNPNGEQEIRYIWNGNREKLEALAKKLSEGEFPSGEDWSVCYQVHLDSGVCEAYTEYNLNAYLDMFDHGETKHNKAESESLPGIEDRIDDEELPFQ